MKLNTEYLDRCIATLEAAFERGQGRPPDDIAYDIYRAACVKEFEIILEQCGSLLKKRLRPFFASNQKADRHTFRDHFRHAAKHGLISAECCERWLDYRNNRNDTAHRYGSDYAERTMELLPAFIADARALAAIVGTDHED